MPFAVVYFPTNSPPATVAYKVPERSWVPSDAAHRCWATNNSQTFIAMVGRAKQFPVVLFLDVLPIEIVVMLGLSQLADSALFGENIRMGKSTVEAIPCSIAKFMQFFTLPPRPPLPLPCAKVLSIDDIAIIGTPPGVPQQ